MPRNPRHYQIYHNMSMNEYHMVFQRNIRCHRGSVKESAEAMVPWWAVCTHQYTDRQ